MLQCHNQEGHSLFLEASQRVSDLVQATLTLADGPAPGQWRFVTDAERAALVAKRPG